LSSISPVSIALGPDGGLLAVADTKMSVRLWDTASGVPLGEAISAQGQVTAIIFSPNGRLLAIDLSDSVRLWEAGARRMVGPPLPCSTFAFSPDGRVLAAVGMGADSATVVLWNPATGEPIGTGLAGHMKAVYGIAFSPDGRTLASVSEDCTVRLWDMATRRQIGKPLLGHTAGVNGAAFSPNGRLLATADRVPCCGVADLWGRRVGECGGAFGEFGGVERVHAAFGQVAAREDDPFVVHLEEHRGDQAQ